MRVLKPGLALIAACSLIFGLAACGKKEEAPAPAAEAPKAEPYKAAFVYLGPVGDAGWTYAHDQGRLALEKELGDKVKTSYVENVPEGADAERVIRKLALDGNQIIFTTSFGYMEPTLKVATDFPNVKFEHATGYKTTPNMGVYESRFYEGAYLIGVLAGKLSKTNTIGFVGSFPIPEVIRNINAFTLGARSVNPKIKTKVIWVSTWYDPGKEKQAAETLVAQGADVMCQNTDSPATLQVAEAKGLHACGWDSDMSRFAANAHMVSNVNKWGVYYSKSVKDAIDGSWKPGETKWGLSEGMIAMESLNANIPADAAKIFEEKKAAITEGKFHPFAGPIKDQSGAIKIAEGAMPAPGDLAGMNWYVQGVEGTIPK